MFKRNEEEIKKQFYKLKFREDVADILEIEDKSLRYWLYAVPTSKKYSEFNIPKKGNSGYRNISAPCETLKQIQRKLNHILGLIYSSKVCSYGFEKNKSILGNATNHTNKKLVFNIDLKDFFSQIHFGRIRGMFIAPPYSLGIEAATVIAQLVCCDGILPQGAPTSPIISNMICRSMDNNIMKLCKECKVQYTRYADDLSFSTNKRAFSDKICFVEDGIIQLGYELKAIINNNSFTVNKNKIFLNSKNVRQEVTGIVVNEFPNIKRERLSELRAILHFCEKDFYEAAVKYVKKGYCKNIEIINAVEEGGNKEKVVDWFAEVLKGKINYIKQIKGHNSFTYYKYAKRLNDTYGKPVFDLSEFDDLFEKVKKNVFVITVDEKTVDEDNSLNQGSGFLLKDYGLMTSHHVVDIEQARYKAYKYMLFNKQSTFAIGLSDEKCKMDKELDYALFQYVRKESGFELGNSDALCIGSKVTLIGFPNYIEGNTPNIQTCEITGKKTFFGADFYTVSGRIMHGASGGPVLDESGKVVGIIKGGISSLSEDDTQNQGFLPINVVIADLGRNTV